MLRIKRLWFLQKNRADLSSIPAEQSGPVFLAHPVYSKDLEGLSAVDSEWFQWRSLLKNLKVTHCSPSEMLKLMLQNDFSTSFPNIYILLRHCLTLPVTNCTGECSVSHLKRIKSALRSTQTQERLNNLSLLNTESDLLQKLDFSTVIEALNLAQLNVGRDPSDFLKCISYEHEITS